MANALYKQARRELLNAQIDWDSDAFSVILTDIHAGTGYTFSADHTSLSDVPALCRVAVTAITSATITADGAADASDLTFALVPPSSACEALILFKDTGVEATSTLIAFYDTGTGLPIIPNGGDIEVVWDNNLHRIFYP